MSRIYSVIHQFTPTLQVFISPHSGILFGAMGRLFEFR